MRLQLINRDALVGSVLVASSVLWCWATIETIPDYSGQERLGPRGFPFGAGIALGLLGLILMLRGMTHNDLPEEDSAISAVDIRALLTVSGLLICYGLALQQFGFLLATAGIAAIAIGPVLGDWRWRSILGASALLSLGVYFVLGKLLSVYLPVGKLLNLSF